MPVGEIGKNLQAITGCDSLSKRLKEQFSATKPSAWKSLRHHHHSTIGILFSDD
jgi:hypothetical protein